MVISNSCVDYHSLNSDFHKLETDQCVLSQMPIFQHLSYFQVHVAPVDLNEAILHLLLVLVAPDLNARLKRPFDIAKIERKAVLHTRSVTSPLGTKNRRENVRRESRHLVYFRFVVKTLIQPQR